MKGDSKFFVKSVYLILVLILISFFTFQYVSTTRKYSELNEKVDLRIVAENILDQLAGYDSCLAYKEEIKPGDQKINEISHRVLDIDKIQEFTDKYKYSEPNCARNFNYGYYITVEKSDLTRVDSGKGGSIPYGGRDIVLTLDASKSMEWDDKIVYARSAAASFVECASDTDRVGLVAFRDCSNIEKLSDLIMLGKGNNRARLTGLINSISTLQATPIREAVRLSADILKQQSPDPSVYKMLVLLTDGCETCGDCAPEYVGGEGCPAWKNYCNSCPSENAVCDYAVSQASPNIHIFTIGLYTQSACDVEIDYGGNQLRCMSQKTNGRYYLSTSVGKLKSIFCELGKGVPKATETKEEWTFGSESHSEKNSLYNTLSVSLPVSIRYNATDLQPGKITIYLFDGELERVASVLDGACLTNTDLQKSVRLSYRTFLKNDNGVNKICMDVDKKEVCKVLSCDKKINLDNINNPGTYILNVRATGNEIDVVV